MSSKDKAELYTDEISDLEEVRYLPRAIRWMRLPAVD